MTLISVSADHLPANVLCLVVLYRMLEGSFHSGTLYTGRGRRDRTLYTDSLPPSLRGFGPEVPDHGHRRRPKENLLDLVEGEKMGFHLMCLYSKYSVFLGEPNSR